MYRARCGRDEPHQEHRLGTVSNNITRGLKPVLWDPNLALGLGVIHTGRLGNAVGLCWIIVL